MEIKSLLTTYRQRKGVQQASPLTFLGVDGYDVYNITAPFEFEGKRLIAGRVELRESEESMVHFFEYAEAEDAWMKLEGALELPLQDPFVTVIDGQLILGGVKVYFPQHADELTTWQTCFYRMDSLKEATLVFEGPIGMKDLRLKQLASGELLVVTRPQGEKGGRGKIGCTIVPSLESLSLAAIEAAPLLENQFSGEEWGGANELHQLSDTRIGVLGHIARFDESGKRHYYALTFELELPTYQISQPQIIAERSDFLSGPAKRPDLADIVFSGGLLLDGETASFYAGINDVEAQKIEIEHPFK